MRINPPDKEFVGYCEHKVPFYWDGEKCRGNCRVPGCLGPGEPEEEEKMSIVEVIVDKINSDGFDPCPDCKLHKVCQREGLYCLDAIRGILEGTEWEPKEAA